MVRLPHNQQQVFTQWIWSQERAFEDAIVLFLDNMPEVERWQRVATHIPGKTPAEIKEHFYALLHHLYQIEPSLFELPNYSYDSAAVMVEENDWLSVDTTPIQRKKRLTWTEEEHRLFLIGMKKYGKGDWKSIASKVVKSKTATQVASHAQKYFKCQEFPKKERKRASIHDITLENIDLVSCPNDLHAHNVTLQHVQEPQQAQAINQNWVFPPLHDHNVPMHQLQEPQQAQDISQNWVFPPLYAHNVPMHQLQEPQQEQEISQNWVFPPLYAHNVPMHQLQEPQQAQEISQNWVFPPLLAHNVPMHQLQESQQAQEISQNWVEEAMI